VQALDDSGVIMISIKTSENDISALNIHKDMKLSIIESEHRRYLAYHREHIFKL